MADDVLVVKLGARSVCVPCRVMIQVGRDVHVVVDGGAGGLEGVDPLEGCRVVLRRGGRAVTDRIVGRGEVRAGPVLLVELDKEQVFGAGQAVVPP